jgi:hypothetical protein
MQAVSDSVAIEQVLSGLAQRRESLVGAVVAEARTIGGYAELDPRQAADFEQTVREGFDAVLRALGDQRSFRDKDVAFLWSHIRTRTHAGVAEGDMLAVVRVFQRALWDSIIELAGDDADGRAAALVLARPLIGYIDVLSRVVDEAYTEAERALSARASVVRRSAIEVLLAGGEPARGAQLDAVRRAGLDHAQPLAVIVARPASAPADGAALGVATVALARASADPVEPLAALREDEVVVIRPMPDADVGRLADALREASQRLAERRVPLTIGVSTVHAGLAGVPAAYDEACLARGQAPAAGGVLALSELGVADYLVLRAGDRTAWRLLPEPVRAFVEEDQRHGAVLSDTLLAFVACDLNVKLAAERLFVHPNTAHYRLAKIEERTGCSIRRLSDVLLLAIAVRLSRSRG